MIEKFYKGTFCSKYLPPSEKLVDSSLNTEEEAQHIDEGLFIKIDNILGGNDLFENKPLEIFRCQSRYVLPYGMNLTTNLIYQIFQDAHRRFYIELHRQERNNKNRETKDIGLEPIQHLRDKLESFLQYYKMK